MSFKYGPSSEPLQISVKQLFLNWSEHSIQETQVRLQESGKFSFLACSSFKRCIQKQFKLDLKIHFIKDIYFESQKISSM